MRTDLIERFLLKATLVRLRCACGGEMYNSDMDYSTSPKTYVYTCFACGAEDRAPMKFPCVEFRDESGKVVFACFSDGVYVREN